MSKFTKFPKMWSQQLAGIHANGCTYCVALYLLDRASFSKQVILSTSAMRRLGVSRNGKRGALDQLRRAGLIAVEERPDKNPIVTVRWVD
jgi:hypothetical protein